MDAVRITVNLPTSYETLTPPARYKKLFKRCMACGAKLVLLMEKFGELSPDISLDSVSCSPGRRAAHLIDTQESVGGDMAGGWYCSQCGIHLLLPQELRGKQAPKVTTSSPYTSPKTHPVAEHKHVSLQTALQTLLSSMQEEASHRERQLEHCHTHLTSLGHAYESLLHHINRLSRMDSKLQDNMSRAMLWNDSPKVASTPKNHVNRPWASVSSTATQTEGSFVSGRDPRTDSSGGDPKIIRIKHKNESLHGQLDNSVKMSQLSDNISRDTPYHDRGNPSHERTPPSGNHSSELVTSSLVTVSKPSETSHGSTRPITSFQHTKASASSVHITDNSKYHEDPRDESPVPRTQGAESRRQDGQPSLPSDMHDNSIRPVDAKIFAPSVTEKRKAMYEGTSAMVRTGRSNHVHSNMRGRGQRDGSNDSTSPESNIQHGGLSRHRSPDVLHRKRFHDNPRGGLNPLDMGVMASSSGERHSEAGISDMQGRVQSPVTLNGGSRLVGSDDSSKPRYVRDAVNRSPEGFGRSRGHGRHGEASSEEVRKRGTPDVWGKLNGNMGQGQISERHERSRSSEGNDPARGSNSQTRDRSPEGNGPVRGSRSQTRDRSPEGNGPDRGSRSQTRDRSPEGNGPVRGSRSQKRDRSPEGNGPVWGSRSQTRDRSPEGNGLDRGSRSQTRDRSPEGNGPVRGSRSQTRDRSPEGNGPVRGSRSQTRDRSPEGNGPVRGSRSQTRDRSPEGNGLDRGSRSQTRDRSPEGNGPVRGSRSQTRNRSPDGLMRDQTGRASVRRRRPQQPESMVPFHHQNTSSNNNFHPKQNVVIQQENDKLKLKPTVLVHKPVGSRSIPQISSPEEIPQVTKAFSPIDPARSPSTSSYKDAEDKPQSIRRALFQFASSDSKHEHSLRQTDSQHSSPANLISRPTRDMRQSHESSVRNAGLKTGAPVPSVSPHITTSSEHSGVRVDKPPRYQHKDVDRMVLPLDPGVTDRIQDRSYDIMPDDSNFAPINISSVELRQEIVQQPHKKFSASPLCASTPKHITNKTGHMDQKQSPQMGKVAQLRELYSQGNSSHSNPLTSISALHNTHSEVLKRLPAHQFNESARTKMATRDHRRVHSEERVLDGPVREARVQDRAKRSRSQDRTLEEEKRRPPPRCHLYTPDPDNTPFNRARLLHTGVSNQKTHSQDINPK